MSEREYGLALLKADSVDVFNIATTGAGRLWPGRQVVAMVEAGGVGVLIGSTVEMGPGTLAQLHRASTARNLTLPSDPIGPAMYDEDVLSTPLAYHQGRCPRPMRRGWEYASIGTSCDDSGSDMAVSRSPCCVHFVRRRADSQKLHDRTFLGRAEAEMADDMNAADALIIGAGPTGAVAAKRLAEARMRVVVLEQGDWPDYSKARADHTDFELTAGRDWAANPNRRQAPADYPISDVDSDISAVLYNAVGGSTILYAAHWQRNMPSDFCVRTLDGVGDDWPLTYEDLEPYYEQVENDFGVSGLAGDPAFPPGKGPPLPPAPLAPMGRRVAKAHNELGWHWWPAPNAIATRPYKALNPCTQRATCMWGCVEGAKASVDRTHWPENLSLGVQLITGARVRRLEVNQRGLVSGAIYIDRNGREHFQRADVTILAANGIGTPRLLLVSAGDRFSDGLANSSGLVGKRLMMHPFGTVVGLFDEDLGSTHGVWGQHLHSLEFYETDTSRGFVRGAKWGLQPTGGPVSMTRAYPWGEENAVWGDGFHGGIRKRLGRSAMWGIIAEDLPDESNRVVLDPDLKDGDGIPAPKLIYRMSENSYRLLDFHLARAKESLEAAGAYETVIAPLIRETGWHLLGTCKMGTDPESSVVDAWGRTHDIPNLYIFDGSIWPTSSGMNPTATIAAMSLRCTDHLVQQHSSQEVPA